MKYSVTEFALEIRKLYPGDYDDLSDTALVDLWLKKFPEDREKISFSKIPYKQTVANNKKKKGSFFILVGVIIALVVGYIFLFSDYSPFQKNKVKKPALDDFIVNDTADISYAPDTTAMVQREPPRIRMEIQYTGIDIIDSVFRRFGLTAEDINTLKNIYYDSNPDPEQKEGLVCGSVSKNCKWCGNTYFVEQKYMTYKSLIKYFTNPFTGLMLGLSTLLSGDETIAIELHKLCNRYRNGESYDCSTTDEKEFCSLKCENEYKYSRY